MAAAGLVDDALSLVKALREALDAEDEGQADQEVLRVLAFKPQWENYLNSVFDCEEASATERALATNDDLSAQQERYAVKYGREFPVSILASDEDTAAAVVAASEDAFEDAFEEVPGPPAPPGAYGEDGGTEVGFGFVDSEAILQLTNMGFSQDRARDVLESTRGDVDSAMEILLAQG